MRVTSPVTLFATAVWLASACSPIREFPGSLVLERRNAQGRRRAAVVEVAGDDQAGVGSLLLLADLDAGVHAPQLLAAFDRHVEALEWQGEDLLLGFAAAQDVRAFSIYPGLRIRPAPASAPSPRELSWLRLSTRRSRR